MLTANAIIKNKESTARPNWLTREAESQDVEQQIYNFNTGGVYPLEQFNIALPEGNTLIEAEIRSRSSGDENWVLRYKGLFYYLQVEGNKLKNDVVSIGRIEDRHWQLKIESDDGIGKIPPRFRFAWTGHSLYFLARGPSPFMLAYGSGKAGPVERPVTALLNVLNEKKHAGFSAKASVRTVQELSGDAAKDKYFDISWQRTILWLVLVSGVFILATMAFRLLRQMQQE